MYEKLLAMLLFLLTGLSVFLAPEVRRCRQQRAARSEEETRYRWGLRAVRYAEELGRNRRGFTSEDKMGAAVWFMGQFCSRLIRYWSQPALRALLESCLHEERSRLVAAHQATNIPGARAEKAS